MVLRPAPVTIDKRNEVQRSLDESVRKIHEYCGNTLKGYILVAHTENLELPIVAMRTDIPAEDVSEYAGVAVEWKIAMIRESQEG